MLRKYRIKGGSFRVSDEKDGVRGTGEIIELEDDVAERFANQLEAVPPEAVRPSRARQASSAE